MGVDNSLPTADYSEMHKIAFGKRHEGDDPTQVVSGLAQKS